MSCGPGLNGGFAEVNAEIPRHLAPVSRKNWLCIILCHLILNITWTPQRLWYLLDWEWIGTKTLLGPVQVKRKEQPLLQVDEEIQVGDCGCWQMWATWHAGDQPCMWILGCPHCHLCAEKEGCTSFMQCQIWAGFCLQLGEILYH